MNLRVLSASCRQTNRRKALPARCGQPWRCRLTSWRFMVPMHAQKAKGALHEPPVWSPGFSRSGPPEGGTPYRWHDPDTFMVPMHAKKRKGAPHEPTIRSPGFSRSRPPEGGSPNTWRPDGTIHAPKHSKKRKGLSMNRSSQIRMTNDEIRRNDEIRMTKRATACLSPFVDTCLLTN